MPLLHVSLHSRWSACRSSEPTRPKRLYFVNNGVKQLLQNDDREALKVIITGLKVFERQEQKVHICNEITVTCEGQQLSGDHCIRAVSIPATDGLMRGMEVVNTGTEQYTSAIIVCVQPQMHAQ